jgi:hypothetical protein
VGGGSRGLAPEYLLQVDKLSDTLYDTPCSQRRRQRLWSSCTDEQPHCRASLAELSQLSAEEVPPSTFCIVALPC